MKLTTLDRKRLEAEILRKLARHKYWGNKHTAIDNVPKSFKLHLSKEVTRVTKSLIKEGYIIQKQTSYGLQISLNPGKSIEIKQRIREFFTEEYLR